MEMMQLPYIFIDVDDGWFSDFVGDYIEWKIIADNKVQILYWSNLDGNGTKVHFCPKNDLNYLLH